MSDFNVQSKFLGRIDWYSPVLCSWSTNTPPLIFNFKFFLLLILAPAGGSKPARPKLNLFPSPASKIK